MADRELREDHGVTYSVLPHARDANEVRQFHQHNRESWNEAAEGYAAKIDDTIAFLRAGGSNLHPLERANLGSLGEWCESAIHLQCASGRDTLSLLNEGVSRVVGVDISDTQIENARRTSEALGANASWYRCDVLDTPSALDGSADLVYTGRGALCWIHDLRAWSRTVFRLLKPGGKFHVLDDHPVTLLFQGDSEELAPTGLSYFEHTESNRGWPSSFLELGRPAAEHVLKYERLWTLADVQQALAGAGLVLERLGEHPETYWDRMPNLQPSLRGRIPMTFTMLARRPTAPS
jgi:SAM-dependent methyltransferase